MEERGEERREERRGFRRMIENVDQTERETNDATPFKTRGGGGKKSA